MIAVAIVASTTKEALEDIRSASKSADVIELRLDYIKKPDLEILLARRIKPAIITFRRKDEGGKSDIKEEDRIKLLEKAINLGADFIDIELSTDPILLKRLINKAKGTQTRIIISYHNFRETSQGEIIEKYNKIKKLNPDIIKIVVFANSINDNKAIFDLIIKAKDENKKIIAFCMGERGEISRILTTLFGGQMTFASLTKGKESAPGQLDIATLKNVYRIDKLKNAGVYGLVGNPVKHSKGFIVHNKAFDKLKLNNIYINFLVEDLKSFIENFKQYLSGLSITIPFKTEIMGYLDGVDKIARKIGAVNTVIKKGEKLIGYNTDVTGALKAIEKRIKVKGKKVLMIGAGGVARAIAFGIVSKGGNLIILNRTVSKARKLADELKCDYGDLDKMKGLKGVDIIINATSIGMHPDVNKTPISKDVLRKIINKKTVVFDSVYNPIMTKLLKEAKTFKCKIIAGVEMFVNQAAEQFKLFTGRKWQNEISSW